MHDVTTSCVSASVVIPSFNRCALVRQALDALAGQTLPPHVYEVIVSIDGSRDGTQEMLADYQAPYHLRSLWQPNQGRASACNAGARVARGQVIIFLDDDMEPAPGFLEEHLKVHVPSPGRIAALGAVPIFADADFPAVTRFIANKFNAHLARLATPGYQFKLRDFYTGNFSASREAFLGIGGFDETFKIYGNEDLELSVRLRRAGIGLIYLPNAIARQDYTKGFADLARDSMAKGRTAVLLASKHPETRPSLRLDAGEGASLSRRCFRFGLLSLSFAWRGLPDTVIRLVELAERLSFPRLAIVYRLTLDYFYWAGVRVATREDTRQHIRSGRG